MKLTEQDITAVQSMLSSQGWDIFKRWLATSQSELLDTIDDDLGESVVDLFKREQVLGVKKHCNRIPDDFVNFIQSQKNNLNY